MIIARYVKRHTLVAILAAVLGLWLLKLTFDYLAEIERLSASYNYLDALRYTLLNAPEALQDYLPIGSLLGAVVGLGLLANHSELTVMQAAGLSRLHIIGWVMQSALVFVMLGLILGQFVIPTTNQLARQIKHPSDPLSVVNGYWQKQSNQLIAIDYADANGKLNNIKLWQFDNNGHINQALYAKSGRYQHDNLWQLNDIKILTISPDGTSRQSTLTTQAASLPIAPASIYLLTKRAEDMSITDLWQHQRFLASSNHRSLEHEVTFWRKILSPFSILSLMLVACSFVFGSLRSQSLGFRVVIAALFALLFSYLQDFVGFISISTGISPLLMVGLPIIFSALLGLYLIHAKR